MNGAGIVGAKCQPTSDYRRSSIELSGRGGLEKRNKRDSISWMALWNEELLYGIVEIKLVNHGSWGLSFVGVTDGGYGGGRWRHVTMSFLFLPIVNSSLTLCAEYAH